MLCPFLTRVASKVCKMSVCHGLHPAEQDPGKFEARPSPENLGTTMVYEEIKDHHMLQGRFGVGFTGGHSELLTFSGPWHWALLWAGPHVPEIPWAFLLSVLQLAFISPSIWAFLVRGILILVLQEALSSMDHSANLSSFATHLTLCTEPGSFYDSISLLHIGWRLLGQDWKISQLPKEQKLQFFSMQMLCNSVLLLRVVSVSEFKR